MDELNLSPEELARIISFLGYGNLSAPVWFIGIEEGLGGMDDSDVRKNLKTRGGFTPVMDIRDAHLQLHEAGRVIDVEVKANFTQVWLYMAKIMLARKGEQNWRSLELAKEYTRSQLGRQGDKGETFLTELSPIPSKGSSGKEWLRWFETRLGDGLNPKLKQRHQELKRVIAEQNEKSRTPRLVICYSLPRAEDFSKFLGIQWNRTSASPEILSASKNSTKYLLLPFFGNGQMSHRIIEDLIGSKLLS